DIEEQLQSVFRLLALIDIGKQDVPAVDGTFRVPHRKSADLEPEGYAIGTSATVLDVVREPSFNGTCKRGDHAGAIVGMDDVAGRPVLQLLRCLAKVFQQLAVKTLHFASRIHRAYEPWNAVDDQAQILFALAKSLLSALQIFNLGSNAIPANYASAGISQRLRIRSKPAIDVIVPPHTLVYIARLAGCNRMQPRSFRSLNILGM